jgi:hypothetical protein
MLKGQSLKSNRNLKALTQMILNNLKNQFQMQY